MTLDEAIALLNSCHAIRNQSLTDACEDILWRDDQPKPKGRLYVAWGQFDAFQKPLVIFRNTEFSETARFTGDDAQRLRNCAKTTEVTHDPEEDDDGDDDE